MEPLSLSQLLDDALGTPCFEAINLRLLHNLLEAMLGLLVLPSEAHPTDDEGQDTTRKDSLPATTSGPQVTDVATDVDKMKKMMKAYQSDISKDLLGEINGMKAEQSRMAEDIQMIKESLRLVNLQDAASQLLPSLHEQKMLDDDVENLMEKLSLYPALEEVSNMVHCKAMEDCLVGSIEGEGGQDLPAEDSGSQFASTKPPTGPEPGAPSHQRKPSDASATMPWMHPGSPDSQTTTPAMHAESPDSQTTTPGTHPAPPGTQGGAGVHPSPPYMEHSLPGAEKVPSEATPGALGTQMDTTGPKEGGKALPSTQLIKAGHPAAGMLLLTAEGLEIPLDANPKAVFPSQDLVMPWGSSGSSSAPDQYMETVEALRQIGQLGQLYTALKEQVAQLEAAMLDHGRVEKLHMLFPDGDQESISSVLAKLHGQVSSWQSLASDLQSEKGKIRQLEDALRKLEVARADLKVDGSDQTILQLGSMLQDMKQEMKELKEQQELIKATLEQVLTKTSDQQEQLDKLRARMENTMQGQAACSFCSRDMGVQVGLLLQHYEELQEQDEELLKSIQTTVVHLQGDCEKLSSVTGNLLDEHHKMQKAIKVLSQSMETLEKEKRDKKDLYLLQRIDKNADKPPLASQVSHTQFGASMEQLNEMTQEMQSWLLVQEQRWHQLQQQLKEEVASKVDRMELGPFHQQLEEHWKSILEKKLKEKGLAMKADDAAGIKKQLLAHFQCLSCDRPVDMKVPGPHVVSILSMPPLPSRPTRNPHTVLEQEQTQQHGHREQVADGRYPRVPRQCGGQHTLSQAPQHCKRFQTFLPIIKSNEVELVGTDGCIYRGREYEELPVLVGKEAASPRS